MTSLTLAPHLEAAVERMSQDLGLAPDAVIQQAVAAWLRTNGYAPRAAAPAKPAPSTSVTPALVPQAAIVPASAPEGSTALLSALAPEGATALVPAAAPAPDPRSVRAESRTSDVPEAPEKSSPSTPLGQSGALARMAEIDADLAALAKPWPAWSEDAAEDEEDDERAQDDDASDEEAQDDDAQDDDAQDEEAQRDDASQDEEPQDEAPQDEAPPEDDAPPEDEPNTGRVAIQPPPDEDEPPPESTIVLKSVPVVLYLQRGEEEPVRITQDRFIIGRGPHCDLIIDSPRVSREHVALTRVGIMYFLEDLNSSNGTWFNEERVTKKELESGDVISLGNEPVTFFLRGE